MRERERGRERERQQKRRGDEDFLNYKFFDEFTK
jgi:hypothetical protein